MYCYPYCGELLLPAQESAHFSARIAPWHHLRWNGVSFSAPNGKLLPPTQELAAKPTRNAP